VNHVQPNDLGRGTGLVMTSNRVAYGLPKLIHRVGLGEYGFADTASGEPALLSFFDEKHEFDHDLSPLCHPRIPQRSRIVMWTVYAER